MTRTTKGTSRPNVDDRAALISHHVDKVRPLLAAVANAEAVVAARRKEVTEACNYATADLTAAFNQEVTRKYFLEKIVQAGQSMKLTIDRRRLDEVFDSALGIAVQADLFKGKGDTADQQAIYFFQGYNDGINARDPKCDDVLHLATYTQGWTAGQAVNSMNMLRGAELAKARTTPAPDTQDVNLADTVDPRTEEEKIADAAANLANSEWTETASAGEPEVEGGDGEDAGVNLHVAPASSLDELRDDIDRREERGEITEDEAGEQHAALDARVAAGEFEPTPVQPAPGASGDAAPGDVTPEQLVERRRRSRAADAPAVH